MAASRPAPSSGISDPTRAASRLDDLIKEAAWLYYHDELNQSEIAGRMQLSRASVVNYLSEARDRGWVKLYLDSDVFLGHRFAADLCRAYGLKEALIVSDGAGASNLADSRVVQAAADWLPRLLEPGDRLGVSWGETIFRLAQTVPRQIIQDLTVVQLLGSRPAALGFAAETCTTILSQQLGAHCVNLHVPLLVSDKDLADRLRNEPVVAQQLTAIANCNKTVLACGTCDADAHIVRTGLLSAGELARLRGRGATGVICGRLIDAKGDAVPTDIEDRMIGVTLEQMRGKDMSLLVASGKNRARSARAAMLGGFTTHLATSASIAQILLEEAPT